MPLHSIYLLIKYLIIIQGKTKHCLHTPGVDRASGCHNHIQIVLLVGELLAGLAADIGRNIVVDEDGLDGLVVLQYTCQNIVDIKGQSNEIFDLQYFSSFEPPWASAQLARPQVLIKT